MNDLLAAFTLAQPDYSYHFSHAQDERTETLSDTFKLHLRAMNRIVARTGEPLEGNLLYVGHAVRKTPVDAETKELDRAFLLKRFNVVEATRAKESLLEILFVS
jgi:hypothetical protein